MGYRRRGPLKEADEGMNRGKLYINSVGASLCLLVIHPVLWDKMSPAGPLDHWSFLEQRKSIAILVPFLLQSGRQRAHTVELDDSKRENVPSLPKTRHLGKGVREKHIGMMTAEPRS